HIDHQRGLFDVEANPVQLRKRLRNLPEENGRWPHRRRQLDIMIGDWSNVGIVAQDASGKCEIRTHELLSSERVKFELRQAKRSGCRELILGFANSQLGVLDLAVVVQRQRDCLIKSQYFCRT